jgi:hypothetical protein
MNRSCVFVLAVVATPPLVFACGNSPDGFGAASEDASTGDSAKAIPEASTSAGDAAPMAKADAGPTRSSSRSAAPAAS